MIENAEINPARPKRVENYILPSLLLLGALATLTAFAPPMDSPGNIDILKILGETGKTLGTAGGNFLKTLPAIKTFYFENGLLGHIALGGTAGLVFKSVESVREKGFLGGIIGLLEMDTLEKMFTGAVLLAVFDNLSGIKDAFDATLKQTSLTNFAKIGAGAGLGIRAGMQIVTEHKISLSVQNFKDLGLSIVDGASVGIISGAAASFAGMTKRIDPLETTLFAIPAARLAWPMIERFRK